MNNKEVTLPTEPTNLIFTGVAGTGKTHRLLEIQKQYDESVDGSWESWRVQQVSHYGWCEVVCAVLLLEDRLMTVPEMMRHPLVIDKSTANKRNENINQTLWVQLNKHAHPESLTVNTTLRSANYYFDKTGASQWFLLEEVKATLRTQLAELLALYEGEGRQYYAKKFVVSRSCLLSFHQSYGYDEFVEGIRPRINPQTGQMQYEVQQGAFLELCTKASNDPNHRYAMLIDEINRANTSQVFGELMSVIEPSKRMGGATPMSVRLAYSGRQFSVPSNVDIYATMNTQDLSLAMLDSAFRRRFEFITCYSDSSVLTDVKDEEGESVDLARLLQALNQRLLTLFGAEAQLGHSYFMDINNIAQLAKRLYRQVIPQIIEYIKLSAMPAETPKLLAQILYGTSNGLQLSNHTFNLVDENNTIYENIDTYSHSLSLLQTNVHAKSESNPYIEAHVVTGSNIVVLNPYFVNVATETDIETNTTDEVDLHRLYLTAKPYQLLYQSYPLTEVS
ncbi:AAA family ATPase [Psychrobacter sp.]|uniref:McrB family protein n=1 Tax=Psychrobacter sp. TaxID=56811 RepID=UPI0025E56DA9|nr:AAA family ATPase [Psychrobacter sp.]